MRGGWQIACVALIGCGPSVHLPVDDEDTGADADADVVVDTFVDTVDTACLAFANAKCAKFSSCEPFIRDVIFDTDGQCVDRLKRTCLTQHSAAGSGRTPAGTRACASALEAQPCAKAILGEPEECLPKAGKLPTDAGCYDDAQCASAFCARGLFVYCGKCAAPPAEGSPCTSGSCPAPLGCSAGVCVRIGGPGASCKASTACGATLVCKKNVCGLSAKGDVCDPAATPAECAFSGGLSCDGATKTCTPIVLSSIGGACTSAFSCRAGGCVGSKCVPLLTESAACGPSTAPCRSPLLCNAAGTCALPNATSCP